MNRDNERSPLVFPGLLFLALLLFGIPEAHVNAMRASAISVLTPVLQRFAVWRSQEPRSASYTVPLTTPPATETPEKSAVPEKPAAPVISPAAYDTLLADLERTKSDRDRYKNAMHLSNLPSDPPPGIAASIIERRILWQEPLFAIDKGSADGVVMNSGVLHRGAVIGRVVAVGAHASSIALLTHHGMSIAARLSECRVEGVLQGLKEDNGGERFCRMSIVSREAMPKIGESVVTSGYDGAFPAGLWMGVVTAIKKTADFQYELTVRPACNDNAVEIVEVLKGNTSEVPWPVAPKPTRKLRTASK